MQLGDVLADRFVIEEQAGKGGIGVVFRAWDLDAEKPVAVKLLARLSPIDQRRFEREAKLLAEARIPGIVEHVAHGTTEDGVPFLVMQWLEGDTLAKRMEQIGFDVADAVALARAICKPLAALHARGLVHRDLKPENLILGSADPRDVTLIDFGLARDTGPAGTRLTMTGSVLGTPGYMSPEQVRGATVDVRSDLFSLGCIVFEALTGYAAFAGDNFFAVRTKILLTNPPPLEKLCPEAPRPLVELVQAMLAKQPDRRPPSIQAIADALDGLGPIAPGRRRTWNIEPAATAPTLATYGAPTEMGHAPTSLDVAEGWNGVAVVQLRANAPVDVAALRNTLPTVQLDFVDDGQLVLSATSGHDRRALARNLASAARAIADRTSAEHTALVTGTEPLDTLVDRCANLLERTARRSLLGLTSPTAHDAATDVVCDDDTAALLR